MTSTTTATEERHGYRWVILGVLWITYIVVFLNRLSVGPLAPFIKDEFGITSAQVGFIMSAASLGYLLTQIPAGWVADRIGARWPIVVGQLIAAVSMMALFFVPSYVWLITLIFVTGAGCGFLAPSTTQAVVIWFPPNERATVMGFKQTAVSLGGMVGAATLPAVALAMGWRFGFVFLGFTALAVGLTSLVLYREPPPAAGLLIRPGSASSATPLLEILKNREIWLVAMGAFFLNWVEMAMIAHFVLYLTESLLFTVVVAGGLLVAAEAAGTIARPLSGLASDRLFGGRRKPVFIGFAATAASMCLVLGLVGKSLGWVLYPVVFTLGIGAIGFGGVYLTLLSELGGRGGAAKAAGLGSTIAVGGSILGPPAFGYIVDMTASYEIAWLSLAVAGAVSVLLLTSVSEAKRKI